MTQSRLDMLEPMFQQLDIIDEFTDAVGDRVEFSIERGFGSRASTAFLYLCSR